MSDLWFCHQYKWPMLGACRRRLPVAAPGAARALRGGKGAMGRPDAG